MYKVGLEYIIGFRKEGSKLFIDPCIPKDWDKYNIRYEFMETVYNIEVKNPYKVNKGVNYIKLDGNVLEEKYVLLFNDGVEHFVQVVLGSYKDRVQES
jgi:cyclic beta-1,2-glucan synthetase